MQYKAYINGKWVKLGKHLNRWQAYMFATCQFGADIKPKIVEDITKIKYSNLPQSLTPQA